MVTTVPALISKANLILSFWSVSASNTYLLLLPIMFVNDIWAPWCGRRGDILLCLGRALPGGHDSDHLPVFAGTVGLALAAGYRLTHCTLLCVSKRLPIIPGSYLHFPIMFLSKLSSEMQLHVVKRNIR